MEAADSRTTYVDNVWFLATLSRLLFTHVVDWFFKVHELEVDKNGIVKLADFSNAVQVTRSDPTCSDPAGVPYWQAPEIRR